MLDNLQQVRDDLEIMRTQIENIKEFARSKDDDQLWNLADKLQATHEHLCWNPLLNENAVDV